MRNNIAIVIPSYNTSKSIVPTIEKVLGYVPESKIIVIDDNSPDGSPELVRKRFLNDNRVKLIIRNYKGGRGSAVLKGFQEALTDKTVEFIVEMDADLCHDVKYIPIMIEKCRNCDVVVASKYLTGSRIKGLSKKRRIFSRIVNYYIRLMLQVPITDYTNGFRCYKRNVLEKIDFGSFHSKGFIVLSEIIYKIHKNRGSLVEIPFSFTHKEINKSNFNSAEIREAFHTILKLKFNLNNFQLR